MRVGNSYSDNDNSCCYNIMYARVLGNGCLPKIINIALLKIIAAHNIIRDIIIIIINCVRNRWTSARFWTFHFCISHVCLFKIRYVIIILSIIIIFRARIILSLNIFYTHVFVVFLHCVICFVWLNIVLSLRML